MTINEINAAALNIGRFLARQNWWEFSPQEAESFCKTEAAKRPGASDADIQEIAFKAMNYVIS